MPLLRHPPRLLCPDMQRKRRTAVLTEKPGRATIRKRMLGGKLALILCIALEKFLKSYSRRSQWSICRF